MLRALNSKVVTGYDTKHAMQSGPPHNALAVIYGSTRLPAGHLEQATEQLRELLKLHAGAVGCETYCSQSSPIALSVPM
jgi:hypothetical protein